MKIPGNTSMVPVGLLCPIERIEFQEFYTNVYTNVKLSGKKVHSITKVFKVARFYTYRNSPVITWMVLKVDIILPTEVNPRTFSSGTLILNSSSGCFGSFPHPVSPSFPPFVY